MKFLDSFTDFIITMCSGARSGPTAGVLFSGYVVLVCVRHRWNRQIRHLQDYITGRMYTESTRVLRSTFSLNLLLDEEVYGYQRTVGIHGVAPKLNGLDRRIREIVAARGIPPPIEVKYTSLLLARRVGRRLLSAKSPKRVLIVL
jgi:hypothetical protein